MHVLFPFFNIYEWKQDVPESKLEVAVIGTFRQINRREIDFKKKQNEIEKILLLLSTDSMRNENNLCKSIDWFFFLKRVGRKSD